MVQNLTSWNVLWTVRLSKQSKSYQFTLSCSHTGNLPACMNFWPCNRIVQKPIESSAVLPKAPSTPYRERDYLFMFNTSFHCPFHQTINQWIDCSQSPIFPWDRRWRSLSPTGPPSWSLDASETFCTLPSFARIKRPRWRPVGLSDQLLRSHGQIRDREIVLVTLL